MRMFPIQGKRKSVDLCEAFVAGAKGESGDAAVFYGVDQSNLADFYSACKSGADWYYIDNSYFDKTRGTYFRITKNAIQHSGRGATNGARFRALKLKVQPWRRGGNHIVFCPQSDSFMLQVARYKGSWIADAWAKVQGQTIRPLQVREWNRDKIAVAATLNADLVDAWVLVTYSSAAAITALIEGVPIISEAGAASSMSGTYEAIETPFTPDGRERFFGVLADNQWTPSEIARGLAWAAIKEQ
jgi:hypothetical protein